MTTDEMINCLNHMLKTDRKAISHFFLDRVPVPDRTADSDLFIVQEDNGKCKLGMLGILNGMLSFYAEKKIVMVQDTDTGEIVEFTNQSNIKELQCV